MESKYIIPPYPKDSNCPPYTSDPTGTLDIAEFFYNTIQGEGASIGQPALFLRLQGCTLDCQWCDTDWRRGWRYTYEEVLGQMDKTFVLPHLFQIGHRLILTGGSPLKQQDRLVEFLMLLKMRYRFLPEIEVENECVIIPNTYLSNMVTQWNNSPKLENSGMKTKARYKPGVIAYMSEFPNSWFKFVVSDMSDWAEIEVDFLNPNLIKKEQIILMPLGDTEEELEKHRPIAVAMALEHGVRYSTREQIILNEL